MIVEGRLLKVKALFEEHAFLCVYAPVSPIERMAFLDLLCKALEGDNNDDFFLFVGGDFNCTLEKNDPNHVEAYILSHKWLRQIVEEHELSDVWRCFHKDLKQYTWAHVHNNIMSLVRLDRFYILKHHLNIIRKCFICPTCLSDHSLVSCVVRLGFTKPIQLY